jgi:membrane protein DedA with SNARE-associated domain
MSTSGGVLLEFAGRLLASTAGMCIGAVLGYVAGRVAAKGTLLRLVSEKELARAIS